MNFTHPLLTLLSPDGSSMDLFKNEILKPIVHIIKGKCCGVVIHHRGVIDDKHLCFTQIIEDDEMWFVSRNSTGPSSHWLPEFIDINRQALVWMKTYAHPDITDLVQHGWKAS